MKKITTAMLCLLLFTGMGCKQAKKEADEKSPATEEAMQDAKDEVATMKSVSFKMEAKNDSGITGDVTFTEENGNVIMKAELSGLSEGEHAIHIHEKADCSSPDGKSTGGHWNPTFQPHGKWGDDTGYHKGDIGNFVANADGTAVVDFATNEWCIGCDDETKNIIGKAVIVHQGVDDFTSQPSGAAGARVACTGIIE